MTENDCKYAVILDTVESSNTDLSNSTRESLRMSITNVHNSLSTGIKKLQKLKSIRNSASYSSIIRYATANERLRSYYYFTQNYSSINNMLNQYMQRNAARYYHKFHRKFICILVSVMSILIFSFGLLLFRTFGPAGLILSAMFSALSAVLCLCEMGLHVISLQWLKYWKPIYYPYICAQINSTSYGRIR